MPDLHPYHVSFAGPDAGRHQWSQNTFQTPQVHELSTDEIDFISGGVGPGGAVVGAGLGAVAWAVGGGGSLASLGFAMAGGAIAGAFGGVSALGAVWGFNGAMVAGIGQGAFQGGWKSGTSSTGGGSVPFYGN